MELKNKLFKFLFPKKYYKIKHLTEVFEDNDKLISLMDYEINELKKNVSMIDFVNVDEQGLPPHPFKELKDDDRKAYVFSVDQIYSNGKFKELSDYKINHLGNLAIRGSNEQARHNAGIAILAINDFIKLFQEAHEIADEIRKETPGIDLEESLEII